MSRKVWIAGAVAAASIVAGTAIAAEPYLPRAQRAFDRMDSDKDGKVTVAEFLPLAQRRFLRDDSNNDGAVSAAEIDAALKTAMEKRRERILASMDTDRNGSVSRAELDGFVAAMVKGADADSDGGVSFSEARSFRLAKWRKTLQGGGQDQ